MKKTIIIFLIFMVFIFLSSIMFLSIKGYKTNRFNSLIVNEINKNEPELDVELKDIKIKLNIKKLDLFLSTASPEIKYKDINLKLSKIDIYLDFFSILKSNPYVSRIVLNIEELNSEEFKKLILRSKPSNLKSFILNNTSKGNLKGKIDLDLNNESQIINYKINGNIKRTNIVFSDKKINDVSFNFIADKNLILLNSIMGNYQEIKILNGSLNVEKNNDYFINGSLDSEVSLNQNQIVDTLGKFIKLDGFSNEMLVKGKLLNKFKLEFSDTLKLKNFNYELSGIISDARINFSKALNNNLLKSEVKNVNFQNTQLNFIFNKSEKKVLLEGNYTINENKDFIRFNLINNITKNNLKLKVDLDIKDYIKLDIFNYEKDNTKVANILTEFNINEKKEISIKELKYQEGKSLIIVKNLKVDKNKKINKFDNISVKTYQNNIENNSFDIHFGRKILINGETFDSSNLIKNIGTNSEKENYFSNLNKAIDVNFKNVLTKLSIPISNFKLIGEVYKGKLVKITSKSEFPGDNFLDISLKKDNNSNNKILEVYSDLPKVVLADYKFFNGIDDGKLLFTSNYNDMFSSSNLTIENFKVMDAPAFAKLLSLADFGGMIDLLNGEGLSFDIMEIDITDDKKVLKINELYAIGPSISVLIEGYKEHTTGLISLKGTMVPAKNLNKLISKIPVLGEILIGKEVGEGFFGVSFKIKGLPGKTKTTVNPLKTLTPRFITRALEKKKNN